MVDAETFYAAIGVVTPLIAAGLTYSWSTARKGGAMKQKVDDLQKQMDQHVEADATARKEISEQLASTSEKVDGVKEDMAAVRTDIAWIKDAIKNNGHGTH